MSWRKIEASVVVLDNQLAESERTNSSSELWALEAQHTTFRCGKRETRIRIEPATSRGESGPLPLLQADGPSAESLGSKQIRDPLQISLKESGTGRTVLKI